MAIRTDDPVRDAAEYDAEQERKRSRLPKCAYCREVIDDDFCYNMDGDLVHTDCIIDYLHDDDNGFWVSVDNFID